MTAVVLPAARVCTAVLPAKFSLPMSLALEPLSTVNRHIFEAYFCQAHASTAGHGAGYQSIIVFSKTLVEHVFLERSLLAVIRSLHQILFNFIIGSRGRTVPRHLTL